MFIRIPTKRYPSISSTPDHHHEIELIDNTLSSKPSLSSRQETKSSSQPTKTQIGILRQQCYPSNIKNGLNKRKYAKYQDRDHVSKNKSLLNVSVQGRNDELVKGKGKKSESQSQGKAILDRHESFKEPDSAVDVLYENQRGGVCFGKLLFSARALGNLDPTPWTNIAKKPSATDITNSQPPDPSWEWVGKQWSIYPTEDSDEGWEYSFAFHGRFSWHRCKWWNSFVRRRAWVRRRVRKKDTSDSNDQYTFNSDYFTVIPVKFNHGDLASSVSGINIYESYLSFGRHKIEDEHQKYISDFKTLEKVMKASRIDREITEAIENFIQNGKEDFLYLKDQIHEIMRLYIFRASRRVLIFVVLRQLRLALESCQDSSGSENKDKGERIKLLDSAIKAAEEESKIYEFWSEKKKISSPDNKLLPIFKS
ncbi:Meiotically up-regulated gene 65 protein [Erysiphe neolycopersici]|uniref:Meiotically up-regulated gene 65 protein n=1 Tax=Erysiphe neolycopersici TaxID=212602 RepID=A0A420HGC7_9PEZI|nr:Meiotically up-regulated gene 65 protein [Erysiphe neolycopersici]